MITGDTGVELSLLVAILGSLAGVVGWAAVLRHRVREVEAVQTKHGEQIRELLDEKIAREARSAPAPA